MNDDPRYTGWVKLHRKVIDSKVYSNPELLKLWVLCLCKANHTTAWVHLNGTSEPVEVQPGQFITGRYALHREYYPTASESNKSPLTLWRWIEKLAKWGNLNIKANNKYTVIEIINWHLYQDSDKDDQQNEHQVNNKRTSDEHQVNTNKNEKNEKNDENEKKSINEMAERIYSVYPRHVGKKLAIKNIIKAMGETDPEHLLKRVELYSQSVKGQDIQFIPHPATWFNQGRWGDDQKEWEVWKNENKQNSHRPTKGDRAVAFLSRF